MSLLDSRQTEVLNLIIDGYNMQEIVKIQGIGMKNVADAKYAALARLRAKTIEQAAARAAKRKIVKKPAGAKDISFNNEELRILFDLEGGEQLNVGRLPNPSKRLVVNMLKKSNVKTLAQLMVVAVYNNKVTVQRW